MAVQGRLTKDKMGYAMPVDAPAYGPPPGYFKQARFLRFDYETDPESVAEIIPEQLTLTDPATAAIMFVEYPWSTAGCYREAFLGTNVMYEGEKLFFAQAYLDLPKPPRDVRRYATGFTSQRNDGALATIGRDESGQTHAAAN